MPSRSIFNVFGRSPIRPLQKQMSKVYACVNELTPFFKAVMNQDWSLAKNIQNTIIKLECEADELKRDLRLSLPSGLFMAIPRTDVLELVSKQDYVANKARDISGLVFGRQIIFPKSIQSCYLTFLTRCIEAAHQAYKAILELDKLFEVGFKGKEIKIISKMVEKLHDIERETDNMQVEVRRLIFDLEKDLPPIDVIFLYKIIEWTGDIADFSQHVGDRLQILTVR